LLNRKLIRDLVRAKWQYFAIGLMVVLGVVFFNASYAAYVNLDASYRASYKALDFEDFGLTFNAAPERVCDRIQRIPGVRAVEGRLVEDVGLEVESKGTTRKVVGRLITIPTDREPTVNRLALLSGHPLRSSSSREVLLEASFAKHHNLKPGDIVTATRGNSEVRLSIAGIVQSDEYLYVVRSKQELMAVPDTFGVMFVSPEVLGSLVGKPNQINDIRVRVTNASRLTSVMREVKAALIRYRPEEPVPRADQPSYQMLMQDVQGFQAYAILFPAFFLSVAAVAVYSLMLRMVHQQRPMIGLLRSLGYGRTAVVIHYLGLALLVGVIAGVIGSILGQVMARWTSVSYMSQLQIPVMEVPPRSAVLAVGFAIGIITCVVGALGPAIASSKIRPAEAMRPVTPTYGRHSIRLDRLFPHADYRWRIPLRNVFRQPRRTLSTIFGIVAGVTLMMLARGLMDSSKVAIDDLITGSYRYDLRLDFVRERTSADVSRVRSWPGVIRAEGVLELPADLLHEGKTYSAMLSGQPQDSLLHEITDEREQVVRPTEIGAIFGPTLKRRLGLEVGDMVEASLPEGMTMETSSKRLIRVAGFSNEAIGTVVTVERTELVRLFRKDLELPPNAITGIVIRVAPGVALDVRNRLYNMPDAGSVLSVADIRALIENMQKTMNTFVWIMEAFGAALAFAMVFNMVTINVLERASEVATLRTIGVSGWTISGMVAFENLVVTLIGISLGLPIGRWFIGVFWQAAQTPEQQDLFTFTISVLPITYLLAAIGILAVSFLSQVPSLISLGRLNLAEATKERSS
jgi:putative ABC transport system permease protein